MALSNMRIGTRLGGGFLLVTAIMVVVGAIAYFGMSNMSAKTTNIMETSPLVDAAMEIKFSMKGEQLMVMEMLAAGNEQGLDGIWKEHQALAGAIKTYSGAILDGAGHRGRQNLPRQGRGVAIRRAHLFREL